MSPHPSAARPLLLLALAGLPWLASASAAPHVASALPAPHQPGGSEASPATESARRASRIAALDFPGGSALDYLSLVRTQSAKPVNIVANPAIERLSVPAVQLRDVTIFEALSVLEAASAPGTYIQVVRPASDDESLFRINLSVNNADLAQSARSFRAFSLADLMVDRADDSSKLPGPSRDDILTAVTQALATTESTEGKAEVSLHAETSLLLLAGTQRQGEFVDEVLARIARRPAVVRQETFTLQTISLEEALQEIFEALPDYRLPESGMTISQGSTDLEIKVQGPGDRVSIVAGVIRFIDRPEYHPGSDTALALAEQASSVREREAQRAHEALLGQLKARYEDQLQDMAKQVDTLRAENADLRRQLAQGAQQRPSAPDAKPPQ